MNKESESVTKNFQTNKIPGPDGFIGEFCLTFKEELMPISLKLFQKFSKKEQFQIHFTRLALS